MESIYSRLRSWRWERAKELNLPSFFILSNAHLAGVALAGPTTLEALANCPGIGPKKLELFGLELLDQIAQAHALGLEPGVTPVAPVDSPSEPLSPQDLADIAQGLRKELAKGLIKRFRGRFTPAQVEEALQRLAPIA